MHVHTQASDGSLSPTALVALARDRGLTGLAVTDHDTTAGLDEAKRAGLQAGMSVWTGMELSCELPGAHVDILGYLFHAADSRLQALLADIRAARETRARQMVERLQAAGADIEFSDVAAISGNGSIGRPHVAQAMVAKGFVPDVATAFQEYIGRGRPAYAERYKLTPVEAFAAVRAAGGLPSLAHPVPPEAPLGGELRRLLDRLVPDGLGGLECFYPGYTRRVSRWLCTLARHYGLVPTGGSDYHGPWRVGRELGSVDVPPDTIDRLQAAIGGT